MPKEHSVVVLELCLPNTNMEAMIKAAHSRGKLAVVQLHPWKLSGAANLWNYFFTVFIDSEHRLPDLKDKDLQAFVLRLFAGGILRAF